MARELIPFSERHMMRSNLLTGLGRKIALKAADRAVLPMHAQIIAVVLTSRTQQEHPAMHTVIFLLVLGTAIK